MDRLPTYIMEPPATWHRGRLVLIGDAAHVTSPSSGQGASLAIEDALVLAKCIRDRAEHSEAFKAYQQLRYERIRKVMKAARRGNHMKPAGPLGRTLRDALLPKLSRWLAKTNASEWLLHYHIDFDQPIDKELIAN